MESQRILLISTSKRIFYKDVNVGKAGTMYLPSLGIAVVAGALMEEGIKVNVIDLSLYDEPFKRLKDELVLYKPSAVGISFMTPDYGQVKSIVKMVRENTSAEVLCGGVHTTAYPEECVKDLNVDVAFIAEAEESVRMWGRGVDKKDIPGIVYRDENGDIKSNKRTPYIKDLDTTPIPAYHLFDLKEYVSNIILTKKNPAGWLETSRGCVFDCSYCDKGLHGRTFRSKSTERVLFEIENMLHLGFKEIHISDDGFTTNIQRATAICESILAKGLVFPWSCVNGIRVDRVNQELLNIMAKAGCYRISFGIETGNQKVLNDLGKKITLKQVKDAVRIARIAGMEVFGYFMLALPTDTEATLRDTIKFATELDLDLAKCSITVPFPGSPLFYSYEQKKLIKTRDWSLYNVYKVPRKIYDHPNLSWEVVEALYNEFYRKFYWRPRYIFRRIKWSLKNGRLIKDIKAFFSVKWF